MPGTATSVRDGDGVEQSLNKMGSPVFKNFGRFLRRKYADIPLSAVREATSGAIGTPASTVYPVPLTDPMIFTEGSDSADDVGARLLTSTVPALEFGNTNSASLAPMVLMWAANADTAIVMDVPLVNLDSSQNITVNFRGKMASSNDTPKIYCYTQFDEADTAQVADTSDTVGLTWADHTITIATADVHANAKHMSLILKPQAATTDVLRISDIRVTYGTLATQDQRGGVLGPTTTPTLNSVNGDSDGAQRIAWAAGNSDPVILQFNVHDMDTSEDIVLHLYGNMSAGNDTPVVAADTYFGVSDTKIEDNSTAFGSTLADETITIAAADVHDKQTIAIELTPGTHASDALYLYGIWLEYTMRVPVTD